MYIQYTTHIVWYSRHRIHADVNMAYCACGVGINDAPIAAIYIITYIHVLRDFGRNSYDPNAHRELRMRAHPNKYHCSAQLWLSIEPLSNFASFKFIICIFFLISS